MMMCLNSIKLFMIRCWMKLRSDNCNVTNSLCVRLGGGGMAFRD